VFGIRTASIAGWSRGHLRGSAEASSRQRQAGDAERVSAGFIRCKIKRPRRRGGMNDAEARAHPGSRLSTERGSRSAGNGEFSAGYAVAKSVRSSATGPHSVRRWVDAIPAAADKKKTRQGTLNWPRRNYCPQVGAQALAQARSTEPRKKFRCRYHERHATDWCTGTCVHKVPDRWKGYSTNDETPRARHVRSTSFARAQRRRRSSYFPEQGESRSSRSSRLSAGE